MIAALANVDPMYQYSLQYFQSLNNKRMDMSDTHDVVEERVAILIDDITNAFYENICRGLFEKDKMVYAFFIAARIMKKEGKLPANVWQCYIVGAPKLKDEERPKKPDSLAFIKDKVWGQICDTVANIPNLRGFLKDLERGSNRAFWEEYVQPPIKSKHNALLLLPRARNCRSTSS